MLVCGAVSEDTSIPERAAGVGGNVLVVDDEGPVRHMLRIVLEREGFEVREAEDGASALAQVVEAPPDVLLTDVRMAGMSGLDLVESLAQDFPDITLVVMSAFGSVALAMEALNRGAYDYISKPFKQDEVVMTVRKAQERERLRRENLVLRARIEELDTERLQLGDLLVHSAQMRDVATLMRKVARFKSTALVLGESGVGKELASSTEVPAIEEGRHPAVEGGGHSCLAHKLRAEIVDMGQWLLLSGRRQRGDFPPRLAHIRAVNTGAQLAD